MTRYPIYSLDGRTTELTADLAVIDLRRKGFNADRTAVQQVIGRYVTIIS